MSERRVRKVFWSSRAVADAALSIGFTDCPVCCRRPSWREQWKRHARRGKTCVTAWQMLTGRWVRHGLSQHAGAARTGRCSGSSPLHRCPFAQEQSSRQPVQGCYWNIILTTLTSNLVPPGLSLDICIWNR